jgi:calcium-dependent protein kinase
MGSKVSKADGRIEKSDPHKSENKEKCQEQRDTKETTNNHKDCSLHKEHKDPKLEINHDITHKKEDRKSDQISHPQMEKSHTTDNTPHHQHTISEKSDSSYSCNPKKKVQLKATGGSLNKDIRQFYKFKDVLGGGHFGTVRIAYRRDEEPRKLFAVKSISKKNLTKKDLEDLMREVEILSSLDHPNIIKFYETYHDEFYFHIVMELCRGKEVFDRIIEEGNINEHKVSKIIYKVLQAISYCHSAGISHRDLKPENILFETADQDAEIKLIDFGLSRKYDSKEKMHTILGTPYYVAPEVLKGDYDEKCDVWSIGALAYIMLSGDPPFNGNSNNEIFQKIMNEDLSFNKEKWKSVSKEAKDFIKKCMVKNPDHRFSTGKAIEHPWFSKIHEEVHSSENLNPEILENLKNFASPQKFKKMVLKFLVNQLSQKELKQLRQAFYAIDLDHTGQINKDELYKAFQMAGVNVSEEELQKILDTADEKEDGKLNYSEFLVATLNQKKFLDKEKLVAAFKYFDVDDSGYIDSGDLKDAMLRSGKKVINSEDIDSIIEEVTSTQKKLSLKEFLKLFGYES